MMMAMITCWSLGLSDHLSDLKDEVGDNRGAVSSEDQSFEDYNFESGIHPDINFLLYIIGIDL